MEASNLKYILFFVFIALGYYYTSAQLEIKAFEHRDNKSFYYFEVEGKAYFTEDSIAVYLYEPMMEFMVLYNVTNENGIYTGYMKYSKAPVKLWVWQDVIFIVWKKNRIKLYLKKQDV